MPNDVGRRLFYREIKVKQRFLGQPQLLPDVSHEGGELAQIFNRGLHAQLTPQDQV